MTPDEFLADVQKRFDAIIDRVLTQGPPSRPWTSGDASALFADARSLIPIYQDALIARAKQVKDTNVQKDLARRAAAFPDQFSFFVETIVAHWRRLEPPAPPSARMDAEINYLRDRGSITDEQIEQARAVQKVAPGSLADIIRDLGFVNEREIVAARAASLGLLFVDLTRTPIDAEAVKRVSADFCRKYTIIPVKVDATSIPNKLMIAVAELNGSWAAIDEIRLITHCQITPVLASTKDIVDAIDRVYGKSPLQ